MSSSLFSSVKSGFLFQNRLLQGSYFLHKYFLFIIFLFSCFFYSNAQQNFIYKKKIPATAENVIHLAIRKNNSMALVFSQETDRGKYQISSAQMRSKTVFISISIAVILLLLILFVYTKKNNLAVKTKYLAVINKIKRKRNEDILDIYNTDDESVSKESSRNIPDEAFNVILKKIIRFENSDKYLRKDINLTWLSNHLNTNTKYLSEVIKIHRNKSFNNYINGLRIEYITRKLYENPVYREYKITYLAEECGYASPQVFVIAFKKEIGVTPSYFIEQLKNQED
jgi:hypothetical protein